MGWQPRWHIVCQCKATPSTQSSTPTAPTTCPPLSCKYATSCCCSTHVLLRHPDRLPSFCTTLLSHKMQSLCNFVGQLSFSFSQWLSCCSKHSLPICYAILSRSRSKSVYRKLLIQQDSLFQDNLYVRTNKLESDHCILTTMVLLGKDTSIYRSFW